MDKTIDNQYNEFRYVVNNSQVTLPIALRGGHVRISNAVMIKFKIYDKCMNQLVFKVR